MKELFILSCILSIIVLSIVIMDSIAYKWGESFSNYDEFRIYLDIHNLTISQYVIQNDIQSFIYRTDGDFKLNLGYFIPIKNLIIPVTKSGKIIDLKKCDASSFRIHNSEIERIASTPKSALDFNIACCGFKELPQGLKMVSRDFICSSNQLSSLEWSPKRVGGDFDCDNNKLVSLKGCPAIINGSFDCSSNELTSLEGAPRLIGTSFYCRQNYKLRTLRGAPSYILGSFDLIQYRNETKLSQKQLDDYLSFLKTRPANLMDEKGNYLPKEF